MVRPDVTRAPPTTSTMGCILCNVVEEADAEATVGGGAAKPVSKDDSSSSDSDSSSESSEEDSSEESGRYNKQFDTFSAEPDGSLWLDSGLGKHQILFLTIAFLGAEWISWTNFP